MGTFENAFIDVLWNGVLIMNAIQHLWAYRNSKHELKSTENEGKCKVKIQLKTLCFNGNSLASFMFHSTFSLNHKFGFVFMFHETINKGKVVMSFDFHESSCNKICLKNCHMSSRHENFVWNSFHNNSYRKDMKNFIKILFSFVLKLFFVYSSM